MDWRVDFLPCKAKIRRHPDGWQGFLTQSGRKIRRQDMRGGDIKQALKPGDIVVMDNMRSHHVKAVREVLEEKGMKVLYLPPYSPDLNPIEKMWSKMKALLRGWKVRSLDLLPDAVRMALDSVSQLDCRHWFAASAYC